MAELNRKTRSVRRRKAAFSLIEVLIAIAILGTGLLAITGAQIQAMRGGRYGKHSTQAAVIANSQMEQLKRTRWNGPALAPTAWTVPLPVNVQVLGPGGNQIDQSYNLQWRITNVVVGETRAIDVRVTWNEIERPNRTITYSSLRFNVERL